jgi:hypothetical protein
MTHLTNFSWSTRCWMVSRSSPNLLSEMDCSWILLLRSVEKLVGGRAMKHFWNTAKVKIKNTLHASHNEYSYRYLRNNILLRRDQKG